MGEQLVALLPRLALAQLERRLAAQLCQRVARDTLDAPLGIDSCQGGERRDLVLLEPGHLIAADAGDKREVVVGPPPRLAVVAVIADAAVAARQRIRLSEAGRDHLLRVRADPAYVGGEVVGAVGVAASVAQEHHQLVRFELLDALEQGGVDRQLDEEVALGRPGELGVGHLVAPVAQGRRQRDALQEVGVPPKSLADERRLVDHVDPAAHRGEGLGERGPEPVFARPGDDAFDAAPALLVRVQDGGLVLLAVAGQDVDVRAATRSPDAVAVEPGQLERHQVAALEQVVQVGRGEERLIVVPAHRMRCPPAPRKPFVPYRPPSRPVP